MTSARLRPLAERDLIDRTQYYLDRDGTGLGERFFDSALDSLRSAEHMPQAGSSHVGELCGLPGLRTWPVAGFPCSWFYFVNADQLDVVRLLSHSQNLPAVLGSVQ